ncbi:MAG TPA: SsrA-binding protein SmpB [Candidatus Saccharimonadales bacterium]|nr:SsrA-binding protein SmpB [Candidatus Saccharimonadales bacterium]
MAKKSRPAGKIVNRRARFDYELGDTLVVGLQLTGAETKALRLGHGVLRGAYVTIKDNELWLINAQIMGGRGIQILDDAQTRSRKLLAKRQEIDRLIEAKQQGNTIVPLELLTDSRYIKLRIAVGRGKKRYDKRETIKRRQQERDIARQTKG